MCLALPLALQAQDRPDSLVHDTAQVTPAAPPAASQPAPPVRDTVKSAIAVAERPGMPDIRGRRTVWDRDALFASGALTLPDLLALVPGVTVHTSGFIAAVTSTSWYGEPGRVRVFLDGVELDPLDQRVGDSPDLGTIPVFALEEVAVERAAGELRVFLRSWRVRLTTAQTRTDVVTGTENTNLYRGFFGKRLNNGGVIQVAGQQYSTTNLRTRGDGDALGAFFRLGVARGRLTVDGVAHRFGRTRSPTRRYVLASPQAGAIGGFVGRDLTAYLRAAWGDADSGGVWWQVVAATVQHIEDDSLRAGATVADPDTSAIQTQYVGTIGVTRGALRLSATARARLQGHDTRLSPSVRGSWDNRWLALSATAEAEGPDSTARVDGLARLTPFDWLHVGTAYSSHTPDAGVARQTLRGEVGFQYRHRWLTVGIVTRSASTALGMPAFDSNFVAVALGESVGYELGLSGPIVGPFSLDWRIIDWGEELMYRPKTESRAELRVSTALRKYLPRANFLLTAAAVHDYRSAVIAPDGAGGVLRADGASAYSTLLDIKLGAAHIFWYNRNLTGKIYETVPGYLMPRLVQLYGVRWEFWN